MGQPSNPGLKFPNRKQKTFKKRVKNFLEDLYWRFVAAMFGIGFFGYFIAWGVETATQPFVAGSQLYGSEYWVEVAQTVRHTCGIAFLFSVCLMFFTIVWEWLDDRF